MISESNPVFVRIDKYKDILSIVDVINKKIISVKQLLGELEELRTKEEEEVTTWEKNMEEIARKIESMQEELTKG
jgi:hypothetical protein